MHAIACTVWFSIELFERFCGSPVWAQLKEWTRPRNGEHNNHESFMFFTPRTRGGGGQVCYRDKPQSLDEAVCGNLSEVCEQVRYIIVSSGKRPVSLRIAWSSGVLAHLFALLPLCFLTQVHIGPPPDLSIPRHQFTPQHRTRTPSCHEIRFDPHLPGLTRFLGKNYPGKAGPSEES